MVRSNVVFGAEYGHMQVCWAEALSKALSLWRLRLTALSHVECAILQNKWKIPKRSGAASCNRERGLLTKDFDRQSFCGCNYVCISQKAWGHKGYGCRFGKGIKS